MELLNPNVTNYNMQVNLYKLSFKSMKSTYEIKNNCSVQITLGSN